MPRKPEKPPDAEQPPGQELPPFEKSLTELEQVVQELEAGEKPLEESLKLYERGVAALRACHARLDQAEQRIRQLVKGPDGKPVLKDLDAPPGVETE